MRTTGIIHRVSTNYCSILQSALAFLIKPKSCRKLANRNKIKREKETNLAPIWATYLDWAGPSGRASHHLPLPVGRGGRQRTHARGATPPPCSPASPGASKPLLDATRPLAPLALSPRSSPPLDLSLSRRN